MKEAVLDCSPIGVVNHLPGLKNYEAVITEPIDRQVEALDLTGPISYLVEPENPRKIEPFESPLDEDGFRIQLEINGLISDYRGARSDGKASREALLLSLSEREKNIRTYLLEFPGEGVVLPNLVDIAEVRGRDRMVNSYNHKAIIPRISADERNGATLQASEKVEQFLVQAPPESVAVITSPMGWTGFPGFEYGNTQTLIYRKKEDGSLEGVTIVTDLTLEQNKRLLIDLGVEAAKLNSSNDPETIVRVVENPALVSPFLGKSLTLEDVAKKILEIRGYRDITLHLPSGVNRRSIGNMMSDIKKGDKLLEFEPRIENMIQSFRQLVLDREHNIEDPDVLREIALSMEDTILGASEIIERNKNSVKVAKGNSDQAVRPYIPISQRPEDRDRILGKLAERPGCAKGVKVASTRSVLRGSTYNLSSTSNVAISSRFKKGKCSRCNIKEESECGVCTDCAE